MHSARGKFRTSLKESNKKKTGISQPTIHQSYVMKLFDRSVDLAKFSEDSPLYPICRSWMKNTPREKKPVKEEREEPAVRKKIPEILTMINNGIAAEVRVLPPPDTSIDLKPYPKKHSCQEKVNKDSINLDYNLEKPPISKAELLAENKKRWREIREHWQDHMRAYDKRYTDSYEILDGLYNQQHPS